MSWIIALLVNAAILFGLANILPGVKVKSYGTAILVSLVIGFLNATVGWLIRFPLNILTLFLLGFLVKLIVTAIIIKITDALFESFYVKSFGTAVLLAFLMAVLSSIVSYIL